jgi:LytS/YehU family sensor histidine kinase
MRYSLDSPDGTLSTFSKELQHAENYLGIEKIRFGKRLDFIKEIPEGHEDWKMPAMILQPLIENAVKYGVYESIDAKKIFLHAKLQEGYLWIVLGNYFDPDIMTGKGTGTGLKNISQRLDNIYGRGDLLSIRKSENYFEVTLKIPPKDE